MKIVDRQFYNGAQQKIARLGIKTFQEVLDLLEATPLLVNEETDTNSGATVRQLIDDAFRRAGGWAITQSGDIDWRKCFQTNGSQVCIGVEVQVSARSDLVMIDIMHLRDAIESGEIDVGVVIVPSDRLAGFLTDRAPSFKETKRAIEERMRSAQLPIVVVGVEHDGSGPILPKRRKRK